MSSLNLFKVENKKTTGRRNDKIAAQIKEIFSIALTQGDFPLLPNHESESRLPAGSFITITYVDLSPNLRNATVFVSHLNEENKIETLKFFELQTHFFKNLIAQKMKLRFIPSLTFKFDEFIGYSKRIEKLLKNNANK